MSEDDEGYWEAHRENPDDAQPIGPEGPDWRSLFVRAVKAFEEERPNIWLDDEFGVPLPELAESKARYRRD